MCIRADDSETMKRKPKPNTEMVKDTYFKTFAAAVRYARQQTEAKGFVINEDDWHSQITMGGGYAKARPNVDETHQFSIRLYKGTKEQRKQLQIIVYGMRSAYELTHYIN